MNYDVLLSKLKNGDSYTVNPGEGLEAYQVLRPPNKWQLAAGRVIKDLVDKLHRSQQNINQLIQERDEAYNQLNMARATMQDLLNSSKPESGTTNQS